LEEVGEALPAAKRILIDERDTYMAAKIRACSGARVVAVVGAGNVAMDAARVARRLGARAYLIYRRRIEDIPARRAEVINAEEEGVEIIPCANPVRILGGSSVTGISCVRMEMCDIDASGRPSPVPVKGSEYTLDVDIVVEAIGQGPNPLLIRLIPDLDVESRGNVLVNENGQTSLPHVYAGGDVATGAATVIWAMGAAKVAARAICDLLRDE
ncbi:MAG: FAD-dependent oxidoreductase, partial [Methanomicrobiaceae archaeon]|nr:FAD-dependent oxidoreductase [Methanomicrobiaceae archaeon]